MCRAESIFSLFWWVKKNGLKPHLWNINYGRILIAVLTDLSCIIYRNSFPVWSLWWDHDRACSPTKHGEESLVIVIGRKVNLDGAMSKTFRTVLELWNRGVIETMISILISALRNLVEWYFESELVTTLNLKCIWLWIDFLLIT